jgi:hypothetical protein
MDGHFRASGHNFQCLLCMNPQFSMKNTCKTDENLSLKRPVRAGERPNLPAEAERFGQKKN